MHSLTRNYHSHFFFNHCFFTRNWTACAVSMPRFARSCRGLSMLTTTRQRQFQVLTNKVVVVLLLPGPWSPGAPLRLVATLVQVVSLLSLSLSLSLCVCVCVCVCVCARACVCVCACVFVTMMQVVDRLRNHNAWRALNG